MIRLIQFLNEKNHFLEKFYTLNEAQLVRMGDGLFDELETFYNQREDLLKIIKYIDAEIHKAHESHKEMAGLFTDEQKNEIYACLRTKEAYAKHILEQDLQVLGLIDDAKSSIIRELREVQKARKAMAGYKTSEA
ncbi:MAG: hypothetical protein AABY53_01810 [Bdellovibrionota bacterium]